VLYFFFNLTLAVSISYITLRLQVMYVDYHTFLLTNFRAGVSNTRSACDPRRHFVRPAILNWNFQIITISV